MGSLLEALAWCPRLRELYLWMMDDEVDDALQPLPVSGSGPDFRGLRSLTHLGLSFSAECDSGWGADAYCVLTDVAEALVSLTRLEGLTVMSFQPAEVPQCLGQLEGLRELEFRGFSPCVLEDGCLDLPNLESLVFKSCDFGDTEVLPGASALQSLTRIESDGHGPCFFDPQLVQLPRLQHMVLRTASPCHEGAHPRLAILPADLGSLSSTLRELDFWGHELTQFPLALTQLGALQCLRASENGFAELPAGITALSRLTALRLGRTTSQTDPLQLRGKRPLDVRALGDLSGFPALRTLSFQACEVMVCMSMLGAVRHPSLATLDFDIAHPAPECEPVVLQLSQALKRAGRGRVLRVDGGRYHHLEGLECFVPLAQQVLSPVGKFMAALAACAH